MNHKSKYATGIKYGIIAGLAYVLLLLLRYMSFGNSPIAFTGAMIISYMIIIVFFILAGLARRKELGGYATTKEIFQTIFCVILIAEICYALFNYIYLNFIDPSFMERYMQNTIEYVGRLGGDQDAVEAQIERMGDQAEQQKSIASMLKGIGLWLIIDSIVGFIIAAIIKKNKSTEFDVAA